MFPNICEIYFFCSNTLYMIRGNNNESELNNTMLIVKVNSYVSSETLLDKRSCDNVIIFNLIIFVDKFLLLPKVHI